MDARAVAAAADLGGNTLNVWVARGLVPGMQIGARGLRRDFTLEVGTGIIIMAELTKFGLSANVASEICKEALGRQSKRLLIVRPPSPSKLTKTRTVFFDGDGEIPGVLDELRNLAKDQRQPSPSVFVLVDLEILAARMRQAHDEFERRMTSSAKPGDG